MKNINERRKYLKNRKIGDLPPVYPNGWFALLESAQLTKGQVKHVCALGENFAVFRYFIFYKKGNYSPYTLNSLRILSENFLQ